MQLFQNSKACGKGRFARALHRWGGRWIIGHPMHKRTSRPALAVALFLLHASPAGAADAAPKTVLILAGPITGHPRDAHEYEKSAVLLKRLLETSPNVRGVRAEVRFRGWR